MVKVMTLYELKSCIHIKYFLLKMLCNQDASKFDNIVNNKNLNFKNIFTLNLNDKMKHRMYGFVSFPGCNYIIKKM